MMDMATMDDQSYDHEDAVTALIEAAVLPNAEMWLQEAITHYRGKHTPYFQAPAQEFLERLGRAILWKLNQLNLRQSDGWIHYHPTEMQDGLWLLVRDT